MIAMLYCGFFLIVLGALVVIITPVLSSHDFSPRQRYGCAGVISLFLFAGVFGVYAMVGAPEVVRLSQERDMMMGIIKKNITQFSQKIKEAPQSWESWMGMGENFTLTGQTKAAVNAYKEAVKISGGRPEAILAYARAMISEADGVVSDHSKKSLEMVLMQDKENAEARYWMAVRMLQDGNNAEAMQAMRKLYHSLQNDNPVKAMINRQIGRTKTPAN